MHGYKFVGHCWMIRKIFGQYFLNYYFFENCSANFTPIEQLSKMVKKNIQQFRYGFVGHCRSIFKICYFILYEFCEISILFFNISLKLLIQNPLKTKLTMSSYMGYTIINDQRLYFLLMTGIINIGSAV